MAEPPHASSLRAPSRGAQPDSAAPRDDDESVEAFAPATTAPAARSVRILFLDEQGVMHFGDPAAHSRAPAAHASVPHAQESVTASAAARSSAAAPSLSSQASVASVRIEHT